uniref:SEFIR domain-containing protein n=1 Tax=Periophthalmus magnuspinnatus TaxID=409849 RepID=A0A3B3ZDB5_9GOBI
MFTPGWIIGLLLLTAPLSLCSFDIIQDDREVTCSEGLRECTMKDGTAFDFNSVEVSAMSVSVKLCCRGDTCALCLLFKVQVNLTKMEEDESNSGLKDDDNETCAVTVCYKTPQAMPKCKKVKFMVNPARPSQQSTAQVSAITQFMFQLWSWNRKPIPLESLTPCTCFQAWREEERQMVRSRSCPFKNNITLRPYIWKNVTLSVQKGFYNSSTSLLWNVSAPCRFEGELWPCERTPGFTVCTEMKGFKQPLENVSWIQNSKGVWLQIKGMEGELGPFCYNIDRWRWSLFAVAAMLLFSVTLLVTFYLRNFVKKSVIWSRCHGGLVKIHQAHVLVLSPPDSSGEVSSAVCSLGSLLYSSGFSVTVDQWSRRSQLSSGPLPWAHCQLLSIDRKCERVLLVLSPRALDRAQNWSSQDSAASDQQEESPYSDVFRASLFAIQAYKNQGRARERFVLVTFDSQWTEAKICHNELPEILQGLPLFHFPSQTKALLADLCVGRTKRQTKRTQTWGFSGDRYKDCAVSLNSKTCETETKFLKH